jgi:membrane-associated protease RseP (regulator of RpoE activity)
MKSRKSIEDPKRMAPKAEESIPRGTPLKRLRAWVPGVLFIATCLSTFFVGGSLQGEFSWKAGLWYASAIMGILLIHEMGHYLSARYHDVEASLPYFIPIPVPPVGTFGAVIVMRKPPETREALLDIGVSGPLSGLCIALVVCFVGLCWSEVRPLSTLRPGEMIEGNSLLYVLLKKLAHPEASPTDDILLHPVAWAGWLGLFVTSLNLLPVGQLDGGHVIYALFGERRHRLVARVVHWLILFLGLIGLVCNLIFISDSAVDAVREAGWLAWVTRGTGLLVWFVWAIVLKFVGGKHPPVVVGERPLSPTRRTLGWIALVVLVLTFTPVVLSPLPS